VWISLLKDRDTLVLISAPDFEKDLEKEIQIHQGKVLERKGRLFIVDHLQQIPVFAQNVWWEPQTFQFESASQAATELKKRGSLWSLHSVAHHRRAELIQDRLKPLKKKPLGFPAQQKFPPIGAWTLWEPNKIIASPTTRSLFPDGEPLFEDKTDEAPSKAYLKLWEWMTITGKYPASGAKCMDLGSCPGGWTWVLSNLGAEVLSVDKAPLSESLSDRKNIRWLKKDAFTLKPEDVGPVDWLFSDIICYPPKLYELVQTWRKSKLVKNFVCTIKFQGETDFATLQKFREIPGSEVLHLSANRHEVTWYLT
jgi:23S rRNA (cytidine2498-2'-O)-methyltransferase